MGVGGMKDLALKYREGRKKPRQGLPERQALPGEFSV